MADLKRSITSNAPSAPVLRLRPKAEKAFRPALKPHRCLNVRMPRDVASIVNAPVAKFYCRCGSRRMSLKAPFVGGLTKFLSKSVERTGTIHQVECLEHVDKKCNCNMNSFNKYSIARPTQRQGRAVQCESCPNLALLPGEALTVTLSQRYVPIRHSLDRRRSKP